ncbi:MAG: dihydroorotase [Planctomycetes bacterium]|nr:dihydroorotase [Planctomycetota bacterium]
MPSPTYDFILRGGTLVSSRGRQQADVGVRNGRITEIGDLSAHDAAEVFDATHLLVLPGVIDSQVHFREPGGEAKEDLETGTRAAVLGGVTAVCEMPNTNPPTTNQAALEDKFRRAKGRAHCDVGFFAGASPDNVDDLAGLEAYPGVPGVKIFMGSSTGTLLVSRDDDLRRVLRATKKRVAVHCEDEDRLNERRALLNDDSPPSMHPVWRDAECAFRATRRLVGLLQETDRKAHILHCTTAEEMAFLADHKDRVTVETTPQHLTLTSPECYERLGTYAQMNPPIRGAAHQEALWKALHAGTVDVLGSDHAPHTREEKDRGYPNTPSGMPGVQTILPVMLEHVHQGRLSLEKLVELLCEGPARVWDIQGKGHTAPGYDADFTLVNPDHTWTIENDWIATRAGWTPFDGLQIHGEPVATIIHGQVVMRDAEVLVEGSGQPLRFATR